MLTVFLNEKNVIAFTCPDADVRPGDFIRFNGKKYLALRRTFDVDSKSYVIDIREANNIKE